MTNLDKLSECADMTEEKFQECFERVDMKAFMVNPTQALVDAGVTLKKDVTFKFVETDAEANALPANVFPLIRTNKNDGELGIECLDKVVGGADILNRMKTPEQIEAYNKRKNPNV